MVFFPLCLADELLLMLQNLLQVALVTLSECPYFLHSCPILSFSQLYTHVQTTRRACILHSDCVFTSPLSPLLDCGLPSAIGIEHVLNEKPGVDIIFRLKG